MRRVFPLVVLSVGFLLLLAPVLQMVRPFVDEKPLEGVVAAATPPAVKLHEIVSESFQRKLTAWFEQHYGLRPTATRLDNSINYWVFRETRPEKKVRIGADGVLFAEEQIVSHNCRTDYRTEAAAFAGVAKEVSSALHARGQELIVLVIPAKQAVYPAQVPAGWQLPFAGRVPSETNIYEPFVEALGAAGVSFVHGRKVIAGIDRDAVYSRTGRHVNGPGTCLVLEEGFRAIRDRLAVPELDCRFRRKTVSEKGIAGEFDLLRILNIWGDDPRDPVMEMVDVPRRPRDDLPFTLIVGSSFSWQTAWELERNHAVGELFILFYNQTVQPRDGSPHYTMPPPQSPAWRQLVIDKPKLYLLPLAEDFLPFEDADFLLQLADAFEISIDEQTRKRLTYSKAADACSR